jgi:hypothetical protein
MFDVYDICDLECLDYSGIVIQRIVTEEVSVSSN